MCATAAGKIHHQLEDIKIIEESYKLSAVFSWIPPWSRCDSRGENKLLTLVLLDKHPITYKAHLYTYLGCNATYQP